MVKADTFGDFALFGFSQNPGGLQAKLADRLGIAPQVINFGRAGAFFFYTNYGDVVETEELIALKLGFARTPDKTPLSTRDLLAQKLLSPQAVNPQGFRGNALVACFSKTAPEFSVYKTLLALPQLYYTSYNGDILCSSNQRCLITLLDRLELNEEVIPFHFLFQMALGPLSYFRDVFRLFPGQSLQWREGCLTVEYVNNYQFSDNGEHFDQMDDRAVASAYEQIKAVIDAYLSDAARSGHEIVTLLSGGVDSSLLQLIVNDRPHLSRPKSYSYNIHVPSFGFEVDYAREASQIFNTDHTIADLYPEAYPDLLIRSIETAAQPVPAEPEPCKLGLAEFLAARADTPRFYFTGQGADTNYGLTFARKLATLNVFRRIPAAPAMIKGMAALIQFRSAQTADGLREVAQAIPVMADPTAYDNWLNQVDVFTNFPLALRALGDEAVQSALGYRRSLERRYRNSRDFAEQVHFVALLSEGYETGTFGSQFFLANRKEQICPFLDEDITRVALAFKPQVRYLKSKFGFLSHRNTKPVLKQILIQKSYGPLTTKRKGASVFDTDLPGMMKSGPLRDLVLDIDRPGFLSKADFEALLDRPDWFLWNLLTFDIFQKRVLNQRN